MAVQNKRIRFGDNNFIDSDTVITTSSVMTNFPASNLQTIQRSQVFRFNGNFTIDSTNQELYINDGSNQTVSVTTGNYSGGAALATQIQTDLNAASSNWTVTYSSTTRKFTISRSSGTDTLRKSQTTNAIWDTLGYTGSSDESAATGGTSDEARNHTDEWIVFDLGVATDVQEFHLIGPLSEVFRFSSSGTYTLEANTSDSWSSPALSITLTRDSGGIHEFLDGQDVSTEYRYWRFKAIDRTNTIGPQGFKVGHVFLGDYNTLTLGNLGRGFNKTYIDRSIPFESEGGALYFKSLTKKRMFESLDIGLIPTAADRVTLETMYETLGNETPFYLCLDPTNVVSATLSEVTMYCRFREPPVFVNVVRDVYGMSFNTVEAI